MDHRTRRGTWWVSVAELTTVLGLVLAVGRWGMALTVVLALMISLFAWGVLGAMWDGGLAALLPILRRGLNAGLMATAVAGLATALGLASLMIAAALVFSHPQVRLKVGTLWATMVAFPSDEHSETEDHRDLSDAALCAVWQSSHSTLRSARAPTDKAEIVQLRQDCLDELVRRHPDGLAAWMASGAPANDNPHRFLTRWGRSESSGPGGP